jgi:hypothetical protein
MISNQCHQSGRCEAHKKEIRHRSRQKYRGITIPLEISRPIRAGVLFNVDRIKLRDLIIELLVLLDGADAFPTETQALRADHYVGIISGFGTVELVDNGFWGDGTLQCGRWVPYQWYNRARQRRVQSMHGMHRFP